MFKNAETGKFSWTNIATTAKLVITDILPLSPIYAKTKWGSPLIDTANVPKDYKAPNKEFTERI